jgi:hypothetical protein
MKTKIIALLVATVSILTVSCMPPSQGPVARSTRSCGSSKGGMQEVEAEQQVVVQQQQVVERVVERPTSSPHFGFFLNVSINGQPMMGGRQGYDPRMRGCRTPDPRMRSRSRGYDPRMQPSSGCRQQQFEGRRSSGRRVYQEQGCRTRQRQQGYDPRYQQGRRLPGARTVPPAQYRIPSQGTGAVRIR